MISGAELAEIAVRKYLYEDKDRHNNVRLYFRKREGKRFRKVRLREVPGSPEFLEEYAAAAAGRPYGKQKKPREVAVQLREGTLRWLIEKRYYSWSGFKQLEPSTQSARRNILTALCDEPETPGSPVLAGEQPFNIPVDKIELMRDRKAEFVESANGRVKAIRHLFEMCVASKPPMLKRNHAKDVKFLKSKKQGGHHTWSIAEIERYVERHPIGTKAHLALMLFLLLGQRISDISQLGKQHILRSEHVTEQLRAIHPGRWISFTQYKNRNSKPVTLVIPILQQLEDVLTASPTGALTFLETKFKKPHTIKGLGNWFEDRCLEATVPGRAHGLRKAGATIAADNGATAHQLMAIFGWSTLQQAQIYTKQADQKRLAGGAMAMISPNQTGNVCDPPVAAVVKSGSTPA